MPEALTAHTLRLSRVALSPVARRTLVDLPAPEADGAADGPPRVDVPMRDFAPAVLSLGIRPGIIAGGFGKWFPLSYERAAATRPIVDAESVSETTLYVSADGARHWYLPRYRLATLSPTRYDIAVRAGDGGLFRLALGLVRDVPEGMQPPAGAEELPHDVTAWMTFADARGLLMQVPFTELGRDAGGALVRLAAALDLATRDAVVRAVQQRGAQVMIRRTVHVAALLADATRRGIVLDQKLEVRRREVAPMARLAGRRPLRLRGGDGPDIVDIPDIPGPPAGFDPTGPRPPISVDPPPEPAAPRYHDLDVALDHPADPDPLLLDPALHPYFSEGAGGAPTADADAPLRRIALAFQPEGGLSRQHAYFQDATDPALFYYLPDVYRLGRTTRLPFLPEMVVRMTAPDASSSSAQATVDYIARPLTDPARLESAQAALGAEIPASAPPGAAPRLAPMPARARLRLSVPGGAGVELRDFPEITIDVANGFRQALTVPLAQFRQLFAAAFSADATSLFSGEVLVETGFPSPEAVPVDIRFAHTVGPLLDSIETPAADGSVVVKLRNATESHLRITRLPLRLIRDGAEVAATAQGLDLSAPMDLASNAVLEFTAVPSAPLPGTGPTDAVFDLSGTEVLARPAEILPVISDSSVPADYVRAIRVMALPVAFAGQPAATPAVPPVDLVHVEFETGNSVDLTEAARDLTAEVRLPLVNLLLNEDIRAEYRYRQLVVYRSGDQAQDAEWRRSSSDLLVVPVRSV